MPYYDDKEIIRKCPYCQKKLICGPPMTSDEKADMLMYKGYNYANYKKHLYQCQCKVDHLRGEQWKSMTTEERHAHIEKSVKKHCGVD